MLIYKVQIDLHTERCEVRGAQGDHWQVFLRRENLRGSKFVKKFVNLISQTEKLAISMVNPGSTTRIAAYRHDL